MSCRLIAFSISYGFRLIAVPERCVPSASITSSDSSWSAALSICGAGLSTNAGLLSVGTLRGELSLNWSYSSSNRVCACCDVGCCGFADDLTPFLGYFGGSYSA